MGTQVQPSHAKVMFCSENLIKTRLNVILITMELSGDFKHAKSTNIFKKHQAGKYWLVELL